MQPANNVTIASKNQIARMLELGGLNEQNARLL